MTAAAGLPITRLAKCGGRAAEAPGGCGSSMVNDLASGLLLDTTGLPGRQATRRRARAALATAMSARLQIA